MSRTYRYRHGFSNRKGLKYTEARMRHRDELIDEELLCEIAHEHNDYPCVVGSGYWRQAYDYAHDQFDWLWRIHNSHRDCLPYLRYSHWYDLQQILSKRVDIHNHWDNPYLGYGAQFSAKKKYYRIQGNRAGRHADRIKLSMWTDLPNLKDAYTLRTFVCDQDDCCQECGRLEFVTDDTAAYYLERELSRQDTNWNNWSLT